MLQSGHGMRDGRTDGRSETNIPPNNFVVRGYNEDFLRIGHSETHLVTFWPNYKTFLSTKCIWKCLQNDDDFVHIWKCRVQNGGDLVHIWKCRLQNGGDFVHIWKYRLQNGGDFVHIWKCRLQNGGDFVHIWKCHLQNGGDFVQCVGVSTYNRPQKQPRITFIHRKQHTTTIYLLRIFQVVYVNTIHQPTIKYILLSLVQLRNRRHYLQGLFFVCVQPLRDCVTL